MSSPVIGTHHLVRLILRRDRIRLPLWILGITGLTAASGSAVLSFYDTAEKQAGYAATVESSGAGKLTNGTPYDVDSAAGITAYETTSIATVLVALMVIFLIVRHTRAEEESGRAELLRATVTGRHAATAAAVLVAMAACLLVGLLDTLVLIANGFATGGSIAHGASLAGVGLVFTGVAATAAQVTASARAALGIAGAVLGAAFLIRGVGAVADNMMVHLSPLGWAQAMRPYGEVQWGWFGLLVLVAAAGLAFTAYLTAHRDAGAGMLQPRPGPPRAGVWLGTPLGLALRLQRGLWIGWAIGIGLAAMLFGSLGREVLGMVEDNPEIADFIAVGDGDLLDGFFAYSMLVLAVLAAAFSVSSVLRVRTEEETGRAEMVLATGLSRTRWLLGSLTVTVVATVTNVLLIGIAMAGTHGLVAGEWDRFGPVLGGALGLVPAVLFVTALAVLALGWVPRWAALGWVAFGFALLQAYLGDLLRFPDWLSGLSPFWHLPQMPAEAFTATPGIVILLLAIVAGTAGLVGIRRRDIG